MEVQSFCSFNRSSTEDGMDLANCNRVGPGKRNTEAMQRLPGNTPVLSKQRPPLDLTAEVLALCQQYAGGRPGLFRDRSDPTFSQLWDYTGKKQYNMAYGAHRVFAWGASRSVSMRPTLRPVSPT